MRANKRIPRAVVNRLLSALPMLKAMVPKSRLNNGYCRNDVSEGTRDSARYAKINTRAFAKHGTIEVRLHSGTTNFTKIANWARILHSVAFSKRRVVTYPDAKNLACSYAQSLKWDATLLEYVLARINTFNPMTQERREESEAA